MAVGDVGLLLLISIGSFLAVPVTVKIYRAYRRHYPQEKTAKRTLRSRLHQHIFHETYIGTTMDMTQIVLSLGSCG